MTKTYNDITFCEEAKTSIVVDTWILFEHSPEAYFFASCIEQESLFVSAINLMVDKWNENLS